MLLDGGSTHGLSSCNNAISDRMDRSSSSSFPEISAARFFDFSSHFMALTTHMSLSLASHSTTACNSVFTESLLLNNSSVDFSAASAARAVIGHLMHCLMLQDSLGHTRHRLLLRRFDHLDFEGARSPLSTSADTPQLFLLQSHVLCARPFFITRRSRTGVTIDLVNTTHWNARLPPRQSCSFSQAWQISLSLSVDFNCHTHRCSTQNNDR